MNTKKWMTATATAVVMILVAMSGTAEAKKETEIPGAPCGQCVPALHTGNMICELTSCEAGCQYVCRYEEPIEFD